MKITKNLHKRKMIGYMNNDKEYNLIIKKQTKNKRLNNKPNTHKQKIISRRLHKTIKCVSTSITYARAVPFTKQKLNGVSDIL